MSSQIETLPTRSQDVQPLANVLSISTAGKNRYLFHFSNVNALTQWTAGIRLAMYEHATLQEAYTGALIAGKGKHLNNIKVIMERTRLVTEEWCRVRFGAGTPWRRCWCVITPPDEKEVQKQQKALKKKSAYDRTPVILKGDVKFYDTKRTKKVQPIATISDAYSAYAIYPQSKPLIDQSTLVKIEGVITIHSKPEATTEGFIFVMPEVHPAVSGFEMMLRFLFPVYDIFALYGRPTRLVADTLDTRSLMFAMPQEKRYGYLEIFDVATLIHTEGSQSWNEREWRKQLKGLTHQRISRMQASGSRPGSVTGGRRSHRNSLPPRTGALRFQDGAIRSTPSLNSGTDGLGASEGTDPNAPLERTSSHQRSASESIPFSSPRRQRTNQEGPSNYTPSRLSYEQNPERNSFEVIPPPPPTHNVPVAAYRNPQVQRYAGDIDGGNERSSSESERRYRSPSELDNHTQNIQHGLLPNGPPAPVASPPAFVHHSGAVPQTRPYHSPELRRANSRMSSTTLAQLAAAGNVGAGSSVAAAGAAAAWKSGRRSEDQGPRGVNDNDIANADGSLADPALANEGMAVTNSGTATPRTYPSALTPSPYTPEFQSTQQHGYLAPSPTSARPVSPLSQSTTYDTSSQIQEMPAAPVSNRFSYSKSPTPQSQASSIGATELPTNEPNKRPEPERLSTSRSVNRKPLPSAASANAPDVPQIDRRSYESDQLAHDNDSVDSPDYASTRKSTETKPSFDKPRTGVLKTVGTTDDQDVIVGDVRYRPQPAQQSSSSSIPNIDFGPTMAQRPELPQTSRSQGRTPSPGRPLSTQYSYQGTQQKPTYGRSSPNDPYNRAPSRNAVTPDPQGYRPGSATPEHEPRRNVAWQPALASGTSGAQAISPEQYVQQRAAANRVVPVYAHARNQSGSGGTPPHGSYDDYGAQNAQQNTPPRPASRGASTVMNTQTDYAAHLSAREQEHVAKVTNSPLINLSGKDQRAMPPPSGGLVGAIEAREQEKRAIKRGVSGQMVQQAIDQRQRQQYGQGYTAQSSSSSRYPQPSPAMHIPGQFPQTPQGNYGDFDEQQQILMAAHPYTVQRQNSAPYTPQVNHPGASVYWQGTSYAQQYVPQQREQQGFSQQREQQQRDPREINAQQWQLQQQQASQGFNPYFEEGQGRR
jgi:CCR4-NOT transcriptional complex subunit CAF120